MTGRILRFLADTRGSASMEFVVIFPLFLGLLVLITDVSLVFNGQARMYRTVQDANRQYALGYIDTDGATETYIRDALSRVSADVEADTSVADRIITSSASVPVSDLTATGLLETVGVRAFRITVRSSHLQEPR